MTLVKVPAGQTGDLQVRVSGNALLTQDGERFEAEDASLSGATTATRAKVAANIPGYTGHGYLPGSNAGDGCYILLEAGDGRGIRDNPPSRQRWQRAGNLDVYVNGKRFGKTTVPAGVWVESASLPLAAGNNIITLRRDLEGPPWVFVDALTVPFEPGQPLRGRKRGTERGCQHQLGSHALFRDRLRRSADGSRGRESPSPSSRRTRLTAH